VKLIDDTRVYFGRKVLQKKLRNLKRSTKVCNINSAKTVGIIYILAQKKIEVSVLGYVHSKKLIDHYLYRKGFDFFTKNNLNWYNRPMSDTVENFLKKPYDILINLSLEKYYPIQYVLALSPSSFKVGKYFEEPNYMDLMIDIEKEKKAMKDVKDEIALDKKIDEKKKEIEKEIEEKVDIELQLSFLINQIMHYLTIIKSN
jgi:hypothetical protein